MAAKLNLTKFQLDEARGQFERQPWLVAIHYGDGQELRREDFGL
jgi:hypothetical protein